MRRFWLPLALALTALPSGWAAAQEDKAPEEPPEELVPPEALGKLTVALDPGGHMAPVKFLHFTADGKHLISGSSDRSVRVWDVAAGRTVRVLRPSGYSCTVMAMSPDGRRLALGAGHYAEKTTYVVYLVSLAEDRVERVLTDPTNWVHALAFSADGKRLAGSDGSKTVRVWDAATGRVEHAWETSELVKGLAFSPDGRRLAQHMHAGQVLVRDLDGGRTTAEFTGARGVPGNNGLAWSPDGRTVAVCDRYGLHLWAPDGKAPRDVLRHRAEAVAFSADSRRVLVTWLDPEPHATLLDVKGGKEVAVFTPPKGVTSLRCCALAPDGRLAAATGDNGVIFLWNPGEVAAVKRLGAAGWLSGDDLQAGWAADGKAVSWRPVERPASWKGGPTSFDPGQLQFGPPLTGAQLHGPVLRRGPLSLKRADAHTVQVLKDDRPLTRLSVDRHPLHAMTLLGKSRVAVGAGAWLFVADANGPQFTQKCRHEAEVFSVAPSPDGRYVVTLSEDQKLRVFADREAPLLTLYVHGRDWIAWTPEGYYAATPGGERLMGWVVDNGPDQLGSFYPAERFRKVLYRPDVIELLLEKGSLDAALASANAARKKAGEKVAAGVADLEQLLPPRAALEVLDRTALPKVKVKATAEAAAKGQPVQSLRLLVDGRPLPDGQGVREWKEGQASAEAVWTVTLPPGAHELKALARSPDTAGVSAAESVDVPVPSAAVDRPALHVIAVGIDKYPQQSLHLDCAVADAKGLADAFTKGCAGPGNLFGAAPATTLLNEQASRAAVLDALQEAHKAVKPGDLLVFSFAGHGARQGRNFYLLTHDADPTKLADTALSGDALRKALADMPCQVLLLLDACHSAAGVRAFIDEAARNLTDDETGVAVLCAAMGAEEAQEKDGHGLFTQAVLKALGDGDDVLYNHHDRRQYVSHLGTYVQDEVKAWSNDEQHPFLTMPYVTESFPIRQLARQSPGRGE
jgi:WD40 repeat protein